MVKWESQLEEYVSLSKQISETQKRGKELYRFNRSTIIASDIAQQYFCEKKVEMQYLYGKIETEAKILGSEGHETLLIDTIRVKREDLWKKIYEDKPIIVHEMFLLSKYKDVVLAGKPDIIIFKNGLPLILFEFKFTRSTRPFRNQHVQARTYGVLLKNLGFDTGQLLYAIVKSHPETKNDETLKQRVSETVLKNGLEAGIFTTGKTKIFISNFNQTEAERDLDWAIEFWKKQREPIPTRNSNKCRACEYKIQCESYNPILE